MNGFITPDRYARVIDLPISMAQTEVRRSKTLPITQVVLALGQTLELRMLTITLVKALTFGTVPIRTNDAMGICSVGLYFGPMICSPLAYAKITSVGTASTFPFSVVKIRNPGLYSVVVANNTTDMDLSICATGVLKLYA